ncbi:MAG: amidohydrolase family protein [Planctomycetota bacterium]
MLIDSHHHLWKYSAEEYGWISDAMSILRQDFLAQQLGEIADENHVDGFVSVQARQDVRENDALLAIASEEPRIKGIVGWVPFAESNVVESLEKYSADERIKGFRHVVQDEPDDRFLLRDDFNRGISAMRPFDLVYDILIFAKHLPATLEFVDKHPDQRFVLDHIAKPTIRGDRFDDQWETHLRSLARRENVTCKFSGVVTEVRDEAWTTAMIRRYFDVTMEAFTPKRVMFGSDWPVCLLQAEYTQWLTTVRELAGQLSGNEQDQLFGQTAVDAYRLAI